MTNTQFDLNKNRFSIDRLNARKGYLKDNIKVIIINFSIFVFIILSFYSQIYNSIFNIEINNLAIFLLPMLYVFLHGNSILFISHSLNSMGKLNLFKSIYIKSALFSLLITILLLQKYTYFSILGAGSIQNLFILFYGFYILKKMQTNKNIFD